MAKGQRKNQSQIDKAISTASFITESAIAGAASVVEKQSSEAVEESIASAEAVTFEAVIETVEDNTQGVSIQAQTAPAAGVLKPQGVYLKSKKTSRLISGPISLKLAQAQVKAYPGLVEIVESVESI